MMFVEIQWQSELYRRELQLRDVLLRAPLGLEFTEADIEAESSQLHFGMVDESQLIACAVIVPLSPTQAKLRQMAVSESHQRRGIGSQLVQAIEAELRDRQFCSIELNARESAVGFYQRLGYHELGSQFVEVTLPHWKMTKRIQ